MSFEEDEIGMLDRETLDTYPWLGLPRSFWWAMGAMSFAYGWKGVEWIPRIATLVFQVDE